MADSGGFTIRKREMAEFAASDDMLQVMLDHANEVAVGAKRDAPVSKNGSHGRRPGYMKAAIRTKYGQDDRGAFADVVPQARTPQGFPYGRMQEQEVGFIKAQIREGGEPS